MGLVNAGLATLTVGYILGVWTACAISAGVPKMPARKAAHHLAAGSPRLSRPSVEGIAEAIWISGPKI
jgi:hypothetical protein